MSKRAMFELQPETLGVEKDSGPEHLSYHGDIIFRSNQTRGELDTTIFGATCGCSCCGSSSCCDLRFGLPLCVFLPCFAGNVYAGALLYVPPNMTGYSDRPPRDVASRAYTLDNTECVPFGLGYTQWVTVSRLLPSVCYLCVLAGATGATAKTNSRSAPRTTVPLGGTTGMVSAAGIMIWHMQRQSRAVYGITSIAMLRPLVSVCRRA